LLVPTQIRIVVLRDCKQGFPFVLSKAKHNLVILPLEFAFTVDLNAAPAAAWAA